MVLALALLAFLFAPTAHAQEVVVDTVTIVKAEVLEVVSEEERIIPGTTAPATYQTIRVQILEGAKEGLVVEVVNDYLSLKEGEVFYLRHTYFALDGTDLYSVSEPYRIPALLFFVGLFLVCLVVIGGMQGVRGLLALIASLFFIAYLLLPGILAGYSPVLVAMGVSSVIIIAGSYLTHGLNRTTSVAVAGMLGTIGITGILAYLAVEATRLSGYVGEETTYLYFNTQGSIDFVGLLLGGLMIGLLGVLYDAAISQAISIEELAAAGPHYSPRQLFARGMRIGREHIGALVNTLAIAYVGASLPLLLLLTTLGTQDILMTINQELFATEIIRIVVGSTGLILAVPITTAIAAYMLHGRPSRARSEVGHGHRH